MPLTWPGCRLGEVTGARPYLHHGELRDDADLHSLDQIVVAVPDPVFMELRSTLLRGCDSVRELCRYTKGVCLRHWTVEGCTVVGCTVLVCTVVVCTVLGCTVVECTMVLDPMVLEPLLQASQPGGSLRGLMDFGMLWSS